MRQIPIDPAIDRKIRRITAGGTLRLIDLFAGCGGISVSNVENLRAAQQERINFMLWEKSHPGERYPNGTFFPTSIFQGGSQGIGNGLENR